MATALFTTSFRSALVQNGDKHFVTTFMKVSSCLDTARTTSDPLQPLDIPTLKVAVAETGDDTGEEEPPTNGVMKFIQSAVSAHAQAVVRLTDDFIYTALY